MQKGGNLHIQKGREFAYKNVKNVSRNKIRLTFENPKSVKIRKRKFSTKSEIRLNCSKSKSIDIFSFKSLLKIR